MAHDNGGPAFTYMYYECVHEGFLTSNRKTKEVCQLGVALFGWCQWIQDVIPLVALSRG